MRLKSMNTSVKIAALAMGLAVVLAGATSASADTPWQSHHPRREEVNTRLLRQNHRITVERREGELTRRQAHELRTDDRGVRNQERFYASRDRGHITKAQQRRLNREENGVSRQIGG
jgi:hypothetical protein